MVKWLSVQFGHIYCPMCKNYDLKETEEPCNECLKQHQPINYDAVIKNNRVLHTFVMSYCFKCKYVNISKIHKPCLECLSARYSYDWQLPINFEAGRDITKEKDNGGNSK